MASRREFIVTVEGGTSDTLALIEYVTGRKWFPKAKLYELRPGESLTANTPSQRKIVVRAKSS